MKANFGGWGGANYSWEIHELEEMYNNTFGGCEITTSYMTFSIMLRGGGVGGAIYHVFSDQPLEVVHPVHLDGVGTTSSFPQIFYSANLVRYSDGTSTWNMPAALTTPNTEAIRIRKFIALAQALDSSKANWNTAYIHSQNLATTHPYLPLTGGAVSGRIITGLTTTQRDAGVYGTYESTKIGHVWSMGVGYSVLPDGSTFGTLYGMAYHYSTSLRALNHQIVFANAGTPNVAIGMGGNVWTTGYFESTRATVTGPPMIVASTAMVTNLNTQYLNGQLGTWYAPNSHVGTGAAAHLAVTTAANGFMIAADKVKLDGMLSTISAATPATIGWYRIATTAGSYSRVSARFEIDWTSTGAYGQVIVNAGVMYGQDPTLNQSQFVHYGANLTKFRIVYHTTFTGNYAYLEVYQSIAAATTINVQLFSSLGWSLVAPSTAGSIPVGYTNQELTFVDGIATEGIIAGASGSFSETATAKNLIITFDQSSFNSGSYAKITSSSSYPLQLYSGANLLLGTYMFGTRTSLYANGEVAMTLMSGGNVGVGIMIPTEKLHVIGNGLFTGTVNGLTLSATTITAPGILSVNSTSTNALNVDSGTTGGINIGTNANAKIVTIGNVTGATSVVVNTGTVGVLFNQVATGIFKIQGTAAPTTDMIQIAHAGTIVTASVNALAITYVGGAAAVESSAIKLDITQGTTSGGIWSGLRITPVTNAVAGVINNGVKFDTRTAGAGTSNMLWAGTGWDNILSYNGTALINGSGLIPSFSTFSGVAITGYALGANSTLLVGDTLVAALGKIQGQINARTSNTGTVTSVGLSVPTGFAVSGTPVTTSGTLALAMAAGYSIPSDATQLVWTNKAPINNPTFTGVVVTPIIESPLYKIRNSANVVKWTVSVNATDELEFKNASGVVDATLTQAGNFTVVGTMSAYDYALHN